MVTDHYTTTHNQNLYIAMYACAELFCVLTNVSSKFVFRRFPLRGGSSLLSPPLRAPLTVLIRAAGISLYCGTYPSNISSCNRVNFCKTIFETSTFLGWASLYKVFYQTRFLPGIFTLQMFNTTHGIQTRERRLVVGRYKSFLGTWRMKSQQDVNRTNISWCC